MDRRDFLSAATLAGVGTALGSNVLGQRAARSLEEATVAELSSMMQKGQMTSEQITNWYLARIRMIDPRINSIIEVNPDAIAIARQRDRERRNTRFLALGPSLHGIPVVIKDNIDTADKMKTTAGSLALMDAPVPKQDAFIVTKLREAGAVILGKTNLSEWASRQRFDQRLVRPRRPNPQSIHPRPQSLRVVVRLRCSHRRQPRRHRDRYRNRRVDTLPCIYQRNCRFETDCRISVEKRDHTDCRDSGYCRAHDTNGCGCGYFARRNSS